MRKVFSSLLFVSLAFSGSSVLAQAKDGSTRQRALEVPVTDVLISPAAGSQTLASVAQVEQFLRQQFPASSHGRLKLTETIESPQGVHYRFRQYYKGKPVYQASVKLSTDKKGRLLSLVSNLYPLQDIEEMDVKVDGNRLAARYLKRQLGNKLPFAKYTVEPVYYIEDESIEEGVLLAYGSRITALGSKEVLLDHLGRVVQEVDLITNYKKAHSHTNSHASSPAAARATYAKASALVFGPDPRTTAKSNGISLAPNMAGNNNATLDLQRQLVNLTVLQRNDTFRLETPYCVIREFDPPMKPVAYSLSPAFNFTRGDDKFEQVNILYHITSFQQHVQQLGFTNLANFQMEVDANGWNGADQSSYSSFTNTLSFGEGGVDDGEDADVVVHEYSHALARFAAPQTNAGLERRALEEANADYFAVSYSKAIDSTDWQNIFNWDGHNEFWEGRKAVTDKRYPADLKGDIYQDASIWTASLMQVQQQLGRDLTDKLLIQSLYSYAPYMSMADAARLFLQADRLLTQGRHQAAIAAVFTKRGLLAQDEVTAQARHENPGK